jgi:hypothetical protein
VKSPQFPALLLLALTLACGSKASVAVSAIVAQPALAVGTPSALAIGLTGSFVLHLELGSVAPSSTDVTVQSLSLETPDKSLVLPLKTIADPAGTVHLEPGQQADVRITLAEGSGTPMAQVITSQQAAAICAAGMADITGAVSDTASGSSTSFTSASFALTGPGCPP